MLTGNMYNPSKGKKGLDDVLGASAKWTLNDCPIDVLITAKSLDGKPWYFVKDNEFNAKTTGSRTLVECAVASAAAPTFFSPWDIKGIGKLVDGGVGVTGNP